MANRDGGNQLRIVTSPTRRLLELWIGVDDRDDLGRGAMAMLADHPERHVWGLGRHRAGSNFFWYLKDPAGNFAEYFSDMDTILEDQLWTPEVHEDAKGLFHWGPPPPPSFLRPDDLCVLDVTPDGLRLAQTAPGVTLDAIRAATAAPVHA